MFIFILTVSWCKNKNEVEEIIIWWDNTNIEDTTIEKETQNTEIAQEELAQNETNKEINEVKTTNDTTKENDTKIEKSQNQKKSNSYTYENKKYNFSIQIPNSWTFQEEEYNFAVLLNTPKDDEINENLWISVQTPQIKTDLNTYYSNSMKKIAEISDNFKEISYTDIEVNWIKWKSVIYESTQWDTIIKSQQTVFIDDDNKVYILQYTATKSTFDKYLNTINWIIKSFEVLN